MATDKSFADFILDQVSEAGPVSCRKMFGEYALYHGTKVVALICDNRLLIKPTPGGRAFIGSPEEAPPYPGAKPAFLVGDKIEDREWLVELIKITADELPEPKPKKKKPKKL